MANRFALYAAIGAGCKQLCIDEETMRAMFKTLTRKDSRKAMDEFELLQVINHLRANGFTEVVKQKGKMSQGDFMLVLWAKLYKQHKVDVNTAIVLDAWVAAQTAELNGGIGISSRKMLPSKLARTLIERLKKWLERVEKCSEVVPDQRAKRVNTLA